MAISTSFSSLRRILAQRMNYWGGDISSNAPGVLSNNGSKNTAIDINRPEPDDEWDESWIVLNPGSSDQINAPTIWRRIASTAGWVQATGTIQIQGTWPAPYVNGPPAGVSYELYKVFHPGDWLQAVNWSLANSYPKRHISVSFEIPQDYYGRIIKWGDLVKNLALSNPSVAPTVSEVANGAGLYQPGTYTFAYTYYNDIGETLISPIVNVNFTGVNSMVDFASITGIPAAAKGVNYYSSIQPGDSQLGLLSIGRGSQPGTGTIGFRGENLNGTVAEIQFPDPYDGYNAFPPFFNSTNVDVQELHYVMKRINPGSYPEIWDDLGSDLYKPMGGKAILLMYQPLGYQSIRLMCTASVPQITMETDVTDEPPELLYAGAESYLWNLLVKTSTIVNTNWRDLSASAGVLYEHLKSLYALDPPRDILYKPVIRVQY